MRPLLEEAEEHAICVTTSPRCTRVSQWLSRSAKGPSSAAAPDPPSAAPARPPAGPDRPCRSAARSGPAPCPAADSTGRGRWARTRWSGPWAGSGATRAAGGQPHARARAEEAVVVVDESDEAVVDSLVVGHVGVGGVDADRLADDLGERALRPHKVVEHLGGPDLVPGEDALLELGVQRGILGGLGHGSGPPCARRITTARSARGQRDLGHVQHHRDERVVAADADEVHHALTRPAGLDPREERVVDEVPPVERRAEVVDERLVVLHPGGPLAPAPPRPRWRPRGRL